jgi:hypothetical protein
MFISDAELERLAILAEEAAEVQQIVMKIIRHGYGSHSPFDEKKTPNRELLNKELGDLQLAIQLMVEYFDINPNTIEQRKNYKRGLLDNYLHHNTSFILPNNEPSAQASVATEAK